MPEIVKKFDFPSFFSEGQYETEVDLLEVSQSNHSITIGVPKEESVDESRVPIVPASVRTLVGYGHQVRVETGAGLSSSYSDHKYSEAGAQIMDDKRSVFESQIVVKTSPLTIEEMDLLHPDQVIITPLTIPMLDKEYLEKLLSKKVTCLAMEYYHDEYGLYPVVRVHSEIVGKAAILKAAELLTTNDGGRGTLLGGVSGVPPAKVVVLGAGVVGQYVSNTANALGASVRVFDNNIQRIMRLQTVVGRQLHTSSLNPEYLAYQLTSADVVIGAIHSKTGRSPVIVTEEMVLQMKEGAVIVDVSIDQGGIIETSRMTTLSHPTFIKHGVIHYCVPNMASLVPRTASQALSNILTPLLLKLGGQKNLSRLLFESPGVQSAVYSYKGSLTNEYLAKRFSHKYTPIQLLLTAAQ